MQPTGTLGCFRNPFDYAVYEEFLNSEKWNGGWVKVGLGKSYFTEQNVEYTGHGSKQGPFPYSIYSEMTSNGFWTGGWVRDINNNLSYITKRGIQYDESAGELGSRNNPCPPSLMDDMIYNDLWMGGWIIYDDNTMYYMSDYDPFNDTSACGSGSGSGSNGSGSGSSCESSGGSGSGNSAERLQSGCGVAATLLNGTWSLKISWSDGYMSRPPYATVSAQFEENFKSIFYEMVGSSLHATFSGHFGVRVSGTVNIKFHPDGIKNNADTTYSIQVGLGNYQIPSQYISR